MPQARQQPDDGNIADPFGAGRAAAAQRDIDIVPEPLPERLMPAPPEVRHGAGKIRIVEILREREAEHPPEADGHVAVARKVKINLQQITHGPEPRTEHRCVPGGGHQLAQHIGKQDLFAQTDGKAPRACTDVLEAEAPRVQLGLDIGIADDRPGDELREQADERGERREVPLRPDVPAVDVDGVAHGLERIKADAKRQAHACQRQGKAEQAVHRRQEEVGVFEKAEQPEIQKDGDRQRQLCCPRAAPPLDAQAERPVRNGRSSSRNTYTGSPNA